MSLEQRRDNRTQKQFAEDILNHTKKERVWIDIFQQQLQLEGIDIQIHDSGTDNSGQVIVGNLANNLPDFDVELIGTPNTVANDRFIGMPRFYIEIKTAPEFCDNSFFTFKASSLKSCITNKALILLPRKTAYYLIYPAGMSHILKKKRAYIYKGFSPNDPAVRIYSREYGEYLTFPYAVKLPFDVSIQKIIQSTHENVKLF